MFLGTGLRSRTAQAAENLFLQNHLALSRKQQVTPYRVWDGVRRQVSLGCDDGYLLEGGRE